MPLSGPILGNLIFLEMSGQGFTGSKMLQLSSAIGLGTINNIQATNFYQGTSTGIGTGAGVGTGFVTGIVGPVVGSLIYAEMLGQGLTGSKSLQLANSIGNAFSSHISSGIVNSTSSPVCSGTGIGKLQGIVGQAIGMSIFSMMGAFTLTGSKSLNLALSIGAGIANAFSGAIVTTVITGAGYPPSPLTGIDVGKLM